MSLKDDAFPSSSAFDVISSVLSSSEADRKEAISKGGAIFSFKLKNTQGQEQAWYMDLKQTGTVGKGEAPAGKKADVTLILSDADFGKLVEGKTKAQNMYLQGKLKVKGNVMKATKLEPILSKAEKQIKAKL